MPSKKVLVYFLLLPLIILSCQPAKDNSGANHKLKVIATIFPLYDFARIVGGEKVDVTMLLPPGSDAHNYELRPDDIIKVSKNNVFLFINFEMEQWAYKIINVAKGNTNMLAVETGQGAFLLPLTDIDKQNGQKDRASKFDPHIWLDFDNAQRIIDKIASAFIRRDSKNSDYYLKNAREYKLKLKALDKRYREELTKCKTKVILHAGHWAFAYLAKKYDLKYMAAYTVSVEAEPLPQNIFALVEEIKNLKLPYIYYEDFIAPRLAQTIAQETGAKLLKLNNGHDISKDDIKNGATFISLMEENLVNLKKGMLCP
jgi:zinc transport system substrate-binding protein